MYDYSRLRGIIRQYFKTQENYCAQLGIAQSTLNSRLKGETFFTQPEMEKTIELSTGNYDDIDDIFFTK